MQQATEVDLLISSAHPELLRINDADWQAKPDPEKWSKKEILGHLIDSAQNNLRRFVVSQYQQNDKIVYHQDEWVEYQDYQQAESREILSLWLLLNKQLVRTLRNIPAEKLTNTCDTGKTSPEVHTIAFLAEDYLAHLQHHLKQILRR